MASKGQIDAGARAIWRSLAGLPRDEEFLSDELDPWDRFNKQQRFPYREQAEACLDAANNVSNEISPDRLEERIAAGAQAIWRTRMRPLPSEEFLCLAKVQQFDYRDCEWLSVSA
jgi:hypothetical protein